MTTARSPVFNLERVQQSGPSWVDAMPYMQWADIPNSRLNMGIDPVVHLAAIGMPVNNTSGTRYGGYNPNTRTIHWPANKFGFTVTYGNGGSAYDEQSWDQPHATYSNPAWDSGIQSGKCRVFFSTGDADFADNSIFELDLSANTPTWRTAILGCPVGEYINHYVGSADEVSFRASHPEIDQRVWRHMDGSARPGHNYNAFHYVHNRQWIAQLDHRQLWPNDTGVFNRFTLASLDTQRWIVAEVGGVPPVQSSDSSSAGAVWSDPATGNIYALRGTNNSLIQYDAKASNPANGWSTLLAGSIPSENGCAASNWLDGVSLTYTLLAGGSNCGFGLIDHATNTRTALTIAGSAASAVSTFAAAGAPKLWGLVYCPDLGKYILGNTGFTNNLYTVTVSGATATVEPFVTNSMYPDGAQARTGGMQTCFCYMPSLGGIVFKSEDNVPLRFLKTRKPYPNTGVLAYGVDNCVPWDQTGQTRFSVISAEAPFTRVRVWFFNASYQSAMTIDNAMIGVDARTDRTVPTGTKVNLTFGGQTSVTVPAAELTSYPQYKPSIAVSDWKTIASVDADVADASNPLRLPPLYVYAYCSTAPTVLSEWPKAFNTLNRIHKTSRSQPGNFASTATVGSWVTGSTGQLGFCVPEFQYSVPSKSLMFSGDSTTKATSSTNNGDGAWGTVACLTMSTKDLVVTPFIAGWGGQSNGGVMGSGYIGYATAIISKMVTAGGRAPDILVCQTCSPNNPYTDAAGADAEWTQLMAFRNWCFDRGIAFVLSTPLPQSTKAAAPAGWQRMRSLVLAYRDRGGHVIDSSYVGTNGLLTADNDPGAYVPAYVDAGGYHFTQAGNDVIAANAVATLTKLVAFE